MRVTDVRLLEGDGRVILARASIVIDDMIAIHGLAVLRGHHGGLYLAFPRHLHRDGTKRDTAHPLNAETRAYVERIVFDAYRASIEPPCPT